MFFDEAVGVGVVHQFGSAFAGQLFQDVFAVRIDGVMAQMQLLGTLARGTAFGHQG